MEFYLLIKEAIKASGLKIPAISRRSGVPTYTIYKIMEGRRRTTNVHQAVALVRALKIPCDQLLQIELEELDHVRE